MLYSNASKQKQLELKKRKKRLQSYRSTQKRSHIENKWFSNKQNIVKTIHFTSPIKKSVFFPAIRPLSDFFLTARKEAIHFIKSQINRTLNLNNRRHLITNKYKKQKKPLKKANLKLKACFWQELASIEQNKNKLYPNKTMRKLIWTTPWNIWSVTKRTIYNNWDEWSTKPVSKSNSIRIRYNFYNLGEQNEELCRRCGWCLWKINKHRSKI